MPADRTLRLVSPAKLNLHLEVLGKREDGFHELETVMTAVSIYDSVEFLHGNSENSCGTSQGFSLNLECRHASGLGLYGERLTGDLPPPKRNLVWRTTEQVREAALIDPGLNIESRDLMEQSLAIKLVKRIPSAAGLGGASSNSATTIMALNQLWKLGWSRTRMSQIAASLGSDIPFFIYGGTAICRGRGEDVTPVRCPQALHAVVVRPPASLSTADVFAQVTPMSVDNYSPRTMDAVLRGVTEGRIALVKGLLFNRLQQAAEKLCGWLTELKNEFARLNVAAHLLTGSGSCYFGLCASRRSALALQHRLNQRQLGLAYVCRSC